MAMSRMRHITHTSSHDHESNLDALLEDLQTTVSRSNSQLNLNGTMTSGYREVRRTVTDNAPGGTNLNEYHIEYLNPANTTHHVAENNTSSYSTSSTSPAQRQIYKAETYNYGTTEHRTDSKLKQNISELDSLLEDLNTAQKRNFSSESTALTRHTGIDPGLLEPASSTPQRLLEEKHFREERVVRGRSTSPRRELVFTGTTRSREPSPITPVRQQQFYRYEKSTTTRTTGPMMTDYSSDSSNVLRNNNLAIEDSVHRNSSPSPSGNRIDYHYSNSSTAERRDRSRDQHDAKEYSPQKYTSGKTSNSYAYQSSSSTTRESRSEVPRSPPPHRSPSPVSFTQPPTPSGKTKGPYAYEPPASPPAAPQSPIMQHKFPEQNQRGATVASYKYSSTTTTTNNYGGGPHHRQYPEEEPLMPRPFPSPSPPPSQSEQQPPKRLDELMATFSDTELRNRRNESYHSSYHRYEKESRRKDESSQNLIPNGHDYGRDKERIIEKEREREREKEKEIEKQIVKKEESKNISGPPVYYPPGVELFSKKEEMAAQQQSGGAMYKAKAKYEYESKSKSKQKESSGKAVVPVCLPVCCAMPCTIM